jgi:hypothetical protein
VVVSSGIVMYGGFGVCVLVLVTCVLVFTVFCIFVLCFLYCFVYEYVYLLLFVLSVMM